MFFSTVLAKLNLSAPTHTHPYTDIRTVGANKINRIHFSTIAAHQPSGNRLRVFVRRTYLYRILLPCLNIHESIVYVSLHMTTVMIVINYKYTHTHTRTSCKRTSAHTHTGNSAISRTGWDNRFACSRVVAEGKIATGARPPLMCVNCKSWGEKAAGSVC